MVVGMESYALYTLTAKVKVNALSIVTIGDNIVTSQISTSKQH